MIIGGCKFFGKLFNFCILVLILLFVKKFNSLGNLIVFLICWVFLFNILNNNNLVWEDVLKCYL